MLNAAPTTWTPRALADHFREGPQTDLGDGCEPARPLGFYGLRWRLKLALAVFTGRADALYWPSQPPTAY